MTPLTLIDATAVPADRGGVGRYVDGVIGALEGSVAIACQARDADHFARLAPRARVLPQHPLISRVPLRLVWEQVVLPLLAQRLGARVIHSPHYTLPLFASAARVVTFHDATFFSDPGVHTAVKARFFRWWMRVSARLAKAVVVPSRATADEVERHLRMPLHTVVAHHGVDPAVFHRPEPGELAGSAAVTGLESGWIAFLGTIEPRKNIPALVRAYRAVAGELAAQGRSVPALVLAGGRGWETGLDAEIEATGPPARIVRLGFVPLDELRVVLGGATLVVYPSLGEGFGLPVVEAMACGAPVLTTPRLALPEVGGDAVAYSEPEDEALAAAIIALLDDPERRAALASAGLARAAGFTWAASARAHERAYAEAAR